jgi:cell division septation protein DedD
MATYLAEGILRTLGVKYVPEVKELYTVQCGVFSVKENALALADKLKKDGYNAIVTVR